VKTVGMQSYCFSILLQNAILLLTPISIRYLHAVFWC